MYTVCSYNTDWYNFKLAVIIVISSMCVSIPLLFIVWMDT